MRVTAPLQPPHVMPTLNETFFAIVNCRTARKQYDEQISEEKIVINDKIIIRVLCSVHFWISPKFIGT